MAVPSATTTANRSASAASAADCRTAASTTLPSGAASARVAVAAAGTVTAEPRLKAPRVVELIHMWVMKPTTTRFFTSAAFRRASRSVPTKEFG